MDQLFPGTRERVPGPAVSNRCPVRLGPESKGPQGRPAVLVYSRSCRRARGFDQLSRETRARERGPAVWTRFPGRLGHRSEGPQC